MKSTRRQFIKNSAVAAGAVALGCKDSDTEKHAVKSARKLQRDDRRPNILYVLVDQERWPRHTRALRTPNRDRIKNHAVEFTNANCTYPLCSPSRATLMTGRYPHEAGILQNCDPMGGNEDMSMDVPTLGGVLSDNGYRTGYFGKWHLSGLTRKRTMPEQYGFDEAYLSNQIVGIRADEYIAGRVGDWISQEDSTKPWFAVFAPVNPHDICYPGLRHFYTDTDTESYRTTALPPNYSDVRCPDISVVKDNTVDWGSMTMRVRGPFDKSYFRMYIDFYCYLIEKVDSYLGIVLDSLERSGQWDNTIIIYTSDHGEMAGSHGLQNKGTTMYEENMNVPLLISYPGRFNGYRQCGSLVSNIDVVPTITSLAGASWPEKLHGRSLVSPTGIPTRVRNPYLFAEGGVSPVAYWRGVRTPEWKYWHYTGTGEEMLFNVIDDPLELENRACSGKHGTILRSLRGRVREWRRRTADPVNTFLT